MTINSSDQCRTSQLCKYLGDNPSEVIRSAESLSQLPSSVNESFELLSEVLFEARDGLREEVIEALRIKLLPWLDKNPVTLADLPFLNAITPIPVEILKRYELEVLKLEDRCFDPRFSKSLRNGTLEILDLCDGGNRVESEKLRLVAKKKHDEVLFLQRNPPRPPIPKLYFAGVEVRQDLLFFDRHRIETIGRKANLIVTAGKTEAVIGPFYCLEKIQQWLYLLNLFKTCAGTRFGESETGQLQMEIDNFEEMLRAKRNHSQVKEDSAIFKEFLEDPSSPAPEKFIDPLMPRSDKFDMPEYDHQ